MYIFLFYNFFHICLKKFQLNTIKKIKKEHKRQPVKDIKIFLKKKNKKK